MILGRGLKTSTHFQGLHPMFIEKDIEIVDGKLKLFSPENKDYFPSWLFPALKEHTPWRHEEVSLYGKTYLQPRLTCWYGESNYNYSKIVNIAQPMTKLLLNLKSMIDKLCSMEFDSVLLNYYRDGNDSVGLHSDDEKELGVNPTIASLSFGGSREFVLKHKSNEMDDVKIRLNHGDVLIMSGSLQAHWKHGIPKSKTLNEPRINLTFRKIIELEN